MQQEVSSKMFNATMQFYYSLSSLTTINIYTHLHNNRPVRSKASIST